MAAAEAPPTYTVEAEQLEAPTPTSLKTKLAHAAAALLLAGTAACAATGSSPEQGNGETAAPAPVPTVTASKAEVPLGTDEDPGVVYFQPRLADLKDPESTKLPGGVYTMVAEPGQENSWTVGNCKPDNADNFFDKGAPGAATVAGFSLGRIGWPYALETATEEQKDQIDYVILFDPGTKEDMTDSCDPPETSKRLERWLSMSAAHYMTIVTVEEPSEDVHTGLNDIYLKDIIGTDEAEKVTICAAPGMDHEEIFNLTKNIMTEPAIVNPDNCPKPTGGYHP